jgi:hypothetical protein
MRADFSRWSFDILQNYARHYEGVLHQQGRVWLDADWNEDVLTRLFLLQQETRDVIGVCGTPMPGTAFQVSPNPDPKSAPGDFLITGGAGPKGRYYVHGILAQLEANASYLTQPDLPDAPPVPLSLPLLAKGADQFGVIYLEVWRRLITYLEDSSLREIALGGPDTTARLKTVAQVKVALLPFVEKGVNCASAQAFIPGLGQGTLTTLQPKDAPPPDLCRLPDPANYTGRENRLYRVDIHDAGDVLGGIGSATRTKLAPDVASGATTVVLAKALDVSQVEAMTRSGIVTLTDDDGQTEMAPLSNVAADGKTLTLGRGLKTGFTTAKNATVTGGAARFKWSRDNAAFAAGVTLVSTDRATLTLTSLGRDQATALRSGDLVEISDDASELGPNRGHLTMLNADPDPDQFTVSLADSLPANFQVARHLVLRRWDGVGSASASFDETTTPDMNLGDGVHIQFGGRDLRSGDYWQFATRSADGSVEPLTDAPPMGIRRFRCLLAVARWNTRPRFNKDTILKILVDNKILTEPQTQTAQLAIEKSTEDSFETPAVIDLVTKAGATPENLKRLQEILTRLEKEQPRPLHFTVEDCRQKFPPLTRLPQLHYVSGDGQAAAPGATLPKPLQAGVANGSFPVAGAPVRFRVVAGAGVLQSSAESGNDLVVQSGPDGVAECTWRLDEQNPSQRVEAVLISGDALPVRFNASFADVGQEPGVHVLGLFAINAQATRSPLRNDSNVLPTSLIGGIDIDCDRVIEPATVSRPTCFVTIELPFLIPNSTPGSPSFTLIGNFAYHTLILQADVGAAGSTITWRPSKMTASLLQQVVAQILPGERGILVHVTLKGNFIWSSGDRPVFLDGDVFGVRPAGAGTTDLLLPSGDGRRGGTFEMWFWLIRPPS